MIDSKSDLRYYLSEDLKVNGYQNGWFCRLKNYVFHGGLSIHAYLKALRYTEYYHNRSFHKQRKKRYLLNDVLYILYNRRREQIGKRLGLEIGLNSCGPGILVYHTGFIVVNYEARIGDHVSFHGCNCVGNSRTGVPTIGNNVEFGVGASVIGGVYIADNVRIGAGAVVTKDVREKGATVVGVPGHIIK